MKYLQAVQTFSLFIAPPFVIGYLLTRQPINYLNFDKKPDIISTGIAIVCVMSALPFVNLLIEINSHLQLPSSMAGLETWMRTAESDAQRITESFLQVNNTGALLLNVFIIGVLPSIGEELLFRGVIQKQFTEITRNAHLGIWISAIIFSAFHFQFFGFLPRMILGVIFGYFMLWSQTIWIPIIAHFINNSMAVFAYYLTNQTQLANKADTIGTSSDFFTLSLVSCIMLFFMMYLIYKRENALNTLHSKENHF